ncbi:MAG: class I SAM-dependent methyltransferase, partial [Chloroflexota bacterium]
YDPEKYLPPLSTIHKWNELVQIAIKVAPGIDYLTRPEIGYSQVEFISVQRELKEAVLWVRCGEPWRIATLLGHDGVIHHMHTSQYWTEKNNTEVKFSEPCGWLNEPDPSIIRATMVSTLANQLGGAMLDPTIAYFTTECKPDSVWVRSWRILDWMPFNLKKLKAYLRQRNIGTLTVKKRGSPITPEELESKLKLKGDNSLTVVLTRLHGNPIVIICEDYAP